MYKNILIKGVGKHLFSNTAKSVVIAVLHDILLNFNVLIK